MNGETTTKPPSGIWQVGQNAAFTQQVPCKQGWTLLSQYSHAGKENWLPSFTQDTVLQASRQGV